MTPIIIGIILIVLGAVLSLIVSTSIKNKNIEIQFIKTTTIGELNKNLAENQKQGLEGYREYAELKGIASSDSLYKTPYSEKEVAYYDADIYQVFEEMETYTDDTGTHQRVKRNETLMSNQKSPGAIILQDAMNKNDKAYIEITEHGMQLDTLKTLDKFEPVNMMQQYNFFSGFNYNPFGSKTLGFRMVEKAIPLGQPLYVLGDAYLENGRLNIAKPSDSKKPFIVSVKSESDIIRGKKIGAAVALYAGIILAVLGIASILFLR